jgi:uncharacterized protein (TIGR02271 family)
MAQATSPYTGRPIVDWYDYEIKLHDNDGDDVGNVVEVNPDFIVVQANTGFLGLGEPRTYFVPRSEVAREDEDDWYLSVDKDEIESRGWTGAPTGSEWSDDWSSGTAPQYDDRGRTRIRRYEEDLQVDKVAREAGEVTVSKRVVEDTKTVEVPVRREEVHIERRPVSDASMSASNEGVSGEAFKDQTVTVPVMQEDVEVRKVARPVEEIEITKSATDETRTVDATVRREEFDVDDDTDRADR